MKTKKLVKKLYQACVVHDPDAERKIWFKLLEKSLKHKRTTAVK